MDFESYLMSTGYVDEEIAKVTSGIQSITNTGSQLIFTMKDNSTLTVTLTGLSDENFTTLLKSKIDSLNDALLNKFTYVDNELLFNGQPIINNTVDLTNYYNKLEVDNLFLNKVDKVDLTSEVKNQLPQANMDLVGIAKTTDLADYLKSTDASNTYATITQVDSKANSSDVYTRTQTDSFLSNKSNVVHNHSISDITNLQSSLDDIVNIKPINYIYVGKNGNDTTGDGSANKPYLTVQKAIDIATSGTTIFIFPATYNENLTFKAGVYLTTSVKYGVYITGNHIVDFSGTTIIENIVLNSSSGVTLSFQGTNAQNFQLLGCSVDSTNGHAISWTNTNASSKIYSEDSITSVSASSSTAKCFYAPSTAKGSVITNRYSFKINNPDNIALDIGGNLSFTHTGDQIVGQVLVNNSATTTFASLSNTTLTTPVLTTNSTGMTTMINTVINTMSNPAIAGSGAFSYVAILYANTGVGGASSLNGGLGAISLPMSSLKLRNSTLLPSSQISSGNNSGSFEFNGTDLYFTKGISRDKIAMIGDIPSVTNKLETTNIKAGTNITVTTSGNDVTINSTASGGTGISTWNTFNL